MAALGTESSVGWLRRVWLSAGFNAAVFLVLWVFALLRLHSHYHGEAFLHRGGWLDSFLAVLTPIAVFSRLLQAYRQTQGSRS
jgi:hypothetical protein